MRTLNVVLCTIFCALSNVVPYIVHTYDNFDLLPYYGTIIVRYAVYPRYVLFIHLLEL